MTEVTGGMPKNGTILVGTATVPGASGSSPDSAVIFRENVGLRGIFITGTDTGVGKTHLTCLIARQLLACGVRVAAYKPVCSGAIARPRPPSSSESTAYYQWEDIERLRTATGGEWPDDVICPQRFLEPLAPPIAARLEGRTVDDRLLVEGARRFPGAELLLIEGAGGWLSPLTESTTVADLARELNVPVLIVARAGLGTINHTLLTIESIRSRGLIVAGVVLNEVIPVGDDTSYMTNGGEIEARSGVLVFGTIPHGNALELHREGRPVTIDWQRFAQPMNRGRAKA